MTVTGSGVPDPAQRSDKRAEQLGVPRPDAMS